MQKTIQSCEDGAVASCTALIVSNPFDVMRTRFQIQGEMMKRGTYEVRYKNLFQGMARVGREEGVLALQKGFCAAALWQITQNGIRIGLYPLLRDEIYSLTGRETFAVNVLSAATCGVIGAVISSPFVMLKTRIQADSAPRWIPNSETNKSLPKPEKVRVWKTLRVIYKAQGLRGMWQGVTIAAQRTAVFSLSQLVSYDVAKRHISPYFHSDLLIHLIASTISSFCIVACTCPFDVVMTRSYNKRSGVRTTNNTLKLLLATYRVEGVHGLYKGAVAMFSRTAPHTVTTFIVLEQLKKYRSAN